MMEPKSHMMRLGSPAGCGQARARPASRAGGQMFHNRMPRYEVLSEDAMATLDKGWRRLVTEIGVELMDSRALDLFRAAGQRVEEPPVSLDPDSRGEQVAKPRRKCDLQARNPANSVHIGGGAMACGAVRGPP